MSKQSTVTPLNITARSESGKAARATTASPLASLPDRDEIAAYHLFDERRLVGGLIERAVYTEDERRRIADIARTLVLKARANRDKHGGIDAFMHEYGLSSEEGVILMCLAEACCAFPTRRLPTR